MIMKVELNSLAKSLQKHPNNPFLSSQFIVMIKKYIKMVRYYKNKFKQKIEE